MTMKSKGQTIKNAFTGVFENGFFTRKFNYWLRAIALILITLAVLFGILSSIRNYSNYMFESASLTDAERLARAREAVYTFTIPKAAGSSFAPLTFTVYGQHLPLEWFNANGSLNVSFANQDLYSFNAILSSIGFHNISGINGALTMSQIEGLNFAGITLDSNAGNFAPIMPNLLFGSQSSLKLALAFATTAMIAALAQVVKLFNAENKNSDNFVNSMTIVIALGLTIGFSSSLMLLIFAILALIPMGMITAQAFIVRYKKGELK